MKFATATFLLLSTLSISVVSAEFFGKPGKDGFVLDKPVVDVTKQVGSPQDAAEDFVDKVDGIVTSTKDKIGQAAADAQDNFDQAVADTKDNIDKAVADTQDNIASTKDKIEQAAADAQDNFDQAVADTKDKIDKAVADTKDNIASTKDKIGQAAADAQDNFDQAVADTKDNIDKAVEDTKDNIDKAVADTKDNIASTKDKIGQAAADAQDNFDQAVADTKDNIDKAVADTQDSIASTKDKIGQAAEDAQDNFDQAVADTKDDIDKLFASFGGLRHRYLQDQGHCLDQDVDLILIINKGHLGLLAEPSMTANEDEECFPVIFHTEVQDQGKPMRKQALAMLNTNEYAEETKLSLGKRPLKAIIEAFQVSGVGNAEDGEIYDALTNNCASLIVNMGKELNVKIDSRVIDFTTERLLDKSTDHLYAKLLKIVGQSSTMRGSARRLLGMDKQSAVAKIIELNV